MNDQLRPPTSSVDKALVSKAFVNNARIKSAQALSRTVASHALKNSGEDQGRFHRVRGYLLLTLGALVIWLNLSFLNPLLMGAIFATVLFPLMGKMDPWKLSSVSRAGIITFGFTVVFLAPIALLVILGADAALEKIKYLETINVSGGQFSVGGLIDYLGLHSFVVWIADVTPITQGQIAQFVTRALTSGGAMLGGAIQNFLANLPGALFGALIILLTVFFLLVDGKRAIHFIRQNSIFGRKQTDSIIDNAQSLCFSVIVATIVSGTVQAALIGVACLITGTDGVLLVVLVSFLFSFFPVFGTAPITIFLTAQAFIQGDVTSGIIFLVAIGVVGISDNFVRPYVLKGGAELHPLIGFVAAFGGLEAIGFYGLFIGPVIAGLFFTLLPMVTRSYPRTTRS